jgi:Pyruvate dehydrogenase complex, dehydrogenase (E1) component
MSNHNQLSMASSEDAIELAEWSDALRGVVEHAGPERARQLLDLLANIARDPAIGWQPVHGTPYINTVTLESQPPFPGDLALEEELVSIMRWNALAMVARANAAYGELGGHIASYASAADLFEVGFNHFFKASDRFDCWRCYLLSATFGARYLRTCVPRGSFERD